MRVAIYIRKSRTRHYKPASLRGLYEPDTTFA
jgi:hypothetical protein